MNKKIPRNKLKCLLAHCQVSREMMDSQRFWSIFRSRASRIPQARREEEKNVIHDIWQPRWRLSTVAAGLLVLFAIYSVIDHYLSRYSPLPRSDTTAINGMEPGREIPVLTAVNDDYDKKTLSKVEHVDVTIDYNGLMIFHDEEYGGTFILLAQFDG